MTLKKNYISLFSLLLFPLLSYTQAKVGMKAPELHLEGAYNCDIKALQPESLNGKVVVLDFWATWCSPCVAAFPENNELYAKYKDQGVVFIAITDDPKEKLENFLKKVTVDFYIGRDDDQLDFRNYNITARPTMFILNRDGTIVYRAHDLTEETLLEVIQTNGVAPEPISVRPEVISKGGFSAGEDPVFNGMKIMSGKGSSCSSKLIDQFIIRPSLEPKSNSTSAYRMTEDHVGMTYSSGSLEELFVFLYDLPSTVRIENKTHDSCRYDLVYWRKTDSFEKAVAEIERGLSDGLSIVFDSVTGKKNVNQVSLGKPGEFIKSEEQIEEGTEKVYTPIQEFTNRLEELTRQYYTIDPSIQHMLVYNRGMEWKKLHEASPEEIIAFLKSKGVSIKPEVRVITTYVIRRK